MFLQQAPTDTVKYFIAGYAVFFSVMTLYLVSLFVRFKNLRQDLALLEELEGERE